MVPTSLNTRCRLDTPGGIFGRLVLGETALRVSWWTLRGKQSLHIDLGDVRCTEWWTGREDVNLAIHLADGRTVAAIVPAAGLWKFEIDSRVQDNRTPIEYSGDGQTRVDAGKVNVVPGIRTSVSV